MAEVCAQSCHTALYVYCFVQCCLFGWVADANLHANTAIKAPEASKACMRYIAMCLTLQFVVYTFKYGMGDATVGHMEVVIKSHDMVHI